jgi:hypothetical protein
MYPPSSQLSSPNVCPVLKPSNNALIACTVFKHDEVPDATSTVDPTEVSLHSTCTFPYPQVDPIALKSADARAHPDFTATPRKSIPAYDTQPTLVLYSVDVIDVVAEEVAVDVGLVVAVVTSQLFPNTPEAKSVTAEFNSFAVLAHDDTMRTFK